MISKVNNILIVKHFYWFVCFADFLFDVFFFFYVHFSIIAKMPTFGIFAWMFFTWFLPKLSDRPMREVSKKEMTKTADARTRFITTAFLSLVSLQVFYHGGPYWIGWFPYSDGIHDPHTVNAPHRLYCELLKGSPSLASMVFMAVSSCLTCWAACRELGPFYIKTFDWTVSLCLPEFRRKILPNQIYY